MENIVINGNDQVNIVVKGIQGKQGDPGPPGPPGSSKSYVTDIQEYAKGDGIADDTDAILAAIGDAKTGDTLFFPKRYRVSKPIPIDKNINIQGLGHSSMIYQSSDENLLEFTRLGGAVIQDIYLGSAATSEGKSLMKLSGNVTRSLFRNIFLQGGYYGIHSPDALENSFENISAIALPFFAPCSRNQWWVYIEKTRGLAPNGISFFNINLSSPWGTNGFYAKGGNSEGGINMIGGTIEGQRGLGAEFRNLGHYLTISGMHFEACTPCIKVKNCSNISIQSSMATGDVEIESSHSVAIQNMKIGSTLRIDENSYLVSVDKTKFHYMDVRSQLTKWEQNICDRSVYWGGWGSWTGPLVEPNGSMEKQGRVDEIPEIHGRKNVYRIHGGEYSGLRCRHALPKEEGAKTITARVYVFRENENSLNPVIGIYGGGGGTYAKLPSIPVGKWIPFNAILYVTPVVGINDFDVRIGWWNATQAGYSCLIADPVITVK